MIGIDVPSIVVARRFLEALRLAPPGGQWSFMVPGSNIGLELYINFDKQREASLLAVRLFPQALAGSAIEDVTNRMQKCLLHNMERIKISSRIFDAFVRRDKNGVLSDIVDGVQLMHLAAALQEDFERTPIGAYFRPLWGWSPPDPIVTPSFFWVNGEHDLNALCDALGLNDTRLKSGTCPPLHRWDGRRQELGAKDSWIGLTASNDVGGAAGLQRIGGALSLALPVSRSRTFSGATVERWEFSLKPDGTVSITTPEPLVPPLIVSPGIDEQALAFMRAALVDHVNNQRLQVALEYAAAGWKPRGRLGFLHNSIAFDALYGVRHKVGASIRAGIATGAAGFTDVAERARLLYEIRNMLTHGEVALIEAAPQYLEYLERFGLDPATDQVRLLRTCVWHAVGLAVPAA